MCAQRRDERIQDERSHGLADVGSAVGYPGMRWPRTLSLYVAREILLFTSLCFLGVTFLIASQQLIGRLDQLVEVGVGGADFAQILLYMLSMFAAHAIPIALAFGVTLTTGRLSMSSEILAMRSLGVGTTALLIPALTIAAAVGVGNAWLIGDVEPLARLDMRQLLADVALRGTIVQGGRFRGVRDRVIYADARSDDGILSGVMIYDKTNPDRPYAAFAESGSLRYDDSRGVLSLSLRAGQILIDPDARDPTRVQLVSFDDFTYSFDALSLLTGRYSSRSPDELVTAEIREQIAKIDAGTPLYYMRKIERLDYEIELARRHAQPLAAVLFAAIAVSLGLMLPRNSHALSLVLCATAVFGYYGSLSLGLHLAEEKTLDPLIAVWGPTGLFVALAIGLTLRASRRVGG